MSTTEPQHVRGTRARVLLTSVFGPYAQDDEFGSRAVNPTSKSFGRSRTTSSASARSPRLKYKNHPDARVRDRFRREGSDLATTWAVAMWAAKRWFLGAGGAVAGGSRLAAGATREPPTSYLEGPADAGTCSVPRARMRAAA